MGAEDWSRRAERADRRIGDLATRQHGVVSRAQLVAAGLGRRAIGHRIEAGRLIPLYRGVFAVGHRRLTLHGRWMAAVLAGGEGAVLSHGSAAALWGIRSGQEQLHVTAPRWKASRLDLRFHTSPLPADEVTRRQGIPVTTVPRTLLDLAPALGPHRLERAIQRAEVGRLWDQLSLVDMLARHPHKRGVRAIRLALERLDIGSAVTRSELEDRFLLFVDSAGLPRPQTNQPIEVDGEIYEVDCLWRRPRVIAELDGSAFHSTAHAFERDRRRHRVLEARGWRTIQVTWHHLDDEPEELAADLRRLLSLSSRRL